MDNNNYTSKHAAFRWENSNLLMFIQISNLHLNKRRMSFVGFVVNNFTVSWLKECVTFMFLFFSYIFLIFELTLLDFFASHMTNVHGNVMAI